MLDPIEMTVDLPSDGKGYGETDSSSYYSYLEFSNGTKATLLGYEVQRVNGTSEE